MVAPLREHARLERLALRAADDLAWAEPDDIFRWADVQFGSSLAMTSSMADAVLAHIASRTAPNASIIFIDTGYHFAETIGTRDAVAASLPLEVITARPRQSVTEQDAEYGPRLYERDPDLCCSLRKVRPLAEILAPYRAWASGVRRDESDSRRNTPAVAWDSRRGMVKINPLAYWSADRVDDYIRDNDILVNPLTQQGFPSIGCAPCTRAVLPGEDTRAGRWAGLVKTECGLHV